jgi:D-alanine-D-alanine ligase
MSLSTKQVAVIMGGWGEEREVSMRSGEAVAHAIESLGHQVHRVLATGKLDIALRALDCEVAFLTLHGRLGEDGKVQGLLEVMGLPYTGSGVLASALAMNKAVAKKLFRQHNLATPTGYSISNANLEQLEALHCDLGFPCVVKPARGGSSVGVTLVHTRDQLAPAVVAACRYGGEALVERYVKGKEVTVAVLGSRVLGSVEVTPPGAMFDHLAKSEAGTRFHSPPRLTATRLANVEAMALAATAALGCRGLSRVDFICSESANDVVLEVNTVPGLSEGSLVAKIAKATGLSFERLVEQMLAAARLDEDGVSGASLAPVSRHPTLSAG